MLRSDCWLVHHCPNPHPSSRQVILIHPSQQQIRWLGGSFSYQRPVMMPQMTPTGYIHLLQIFSSCVHTSANSLPTPASSPPNPILTLRHHKPHPHTSAPSASQYKDSFQNKDYSPLPHHTDSYPPRTSLRHYSPAVSLEAYQSSGCHGAVRTCSSPTGPSSASKRHTCSVRRRPGRQRSPRAWRRWRS